jgi:ribonuclease P protein component
MVLPRLTRRREFLRVAAEGKRAARPGVVLQARSAPGQPLRVGFTATKKIGGSVVRNRAKRRLREAARALLAEAPPGWDVVLIAREATPTRRFATLVNDLSGALAALGVAHRR